MKLFMDLHRDYIRSARKDNEFGFNLKAVAKAEPWLSFLYDEWWSVDLVGLKNIPAKGPVLLLGNAGGGIPWAGLMLMYGLMKDKNNPRRLNIMADLDWINDERIYNFAREIGFIPWSADNLKKLFAAGETVLIFPEGVPGSVKPFGERYRVRNFDWTRILPAIEQGVPLIPLATLGADESFPVGINFDKLARMLSLPAFPVTPFFPWLPFPLNLMSLPVKWKIRVMKPVDYPAAYSRDDVEETAKRQALFVEGDVQAELNRLLRTRIKSLF